MELLELLNSASAPCHLRVQRYDEHLGFCKFLGKKMQKKCIFVDFEAKNSELLEWKIEIVLLSSGRSLRVRSAVRERIRRAARITELQNYRKM
jgi:hypothetical protein